MSVTSPTNIFTLLRSNSSQIVAGKDDKGDTDVSSPGIGNDVVLQWSSKGLNEKTDRVNCNLIIMGVFSLISSLVMIGILGYVVFYNNIQRNIDSQNVLTNINNHNQPVATTGYGLLSNDISSELSLAKLSSVTNIMFAIGAGNNNQSSIVLNSNGFAKFPCQADCVSPHVLHFYTSEGTIIYHGDEAYIYMPSPNFLAALQRHNVPQYSNYSRQLMLQTEDDAPLSTDRRRLQWWNLFKVVYKCLSSNYCYKLINWGGKQVYCQYNKYTGRYEGDYQCSQFY